MDSWKKILIAFGAVIGVWLLGYIVGINHFRDEVKMVETETIIKRDTIKEYYPVEVIVKETQRVLVEVRDSIRIHDTLYVALPHQKRFYKEEDFYAEVSGYQPRLDYIEVYPKTVTVTTKETVIQKQSDWKLSVDLGLDFERSMSASYLIPNISACIGYDRVTLGAEAGIAIGETPLPYYSLGIRYSLTKGLVK